MSNEDQYHVQLQDAYCFLKARDQGQAIIADIRGKIEGMNRALANASDEELRKLAGGITFAIDLLDEIENATPTEPQD
jgi:hypothetical protein